MTLKYPELMQHLAKGSYEPVYVLDGEEGFFLDRITTHFEERILTDSERDFNLHVLYGNGKELSFQDVVSACRRFPMFAERQVVILKEAAQMSGVNELASYIENPAPTTIFLLEHRGKKLDGKTRLSKVAQKRAVYFNSSKLKEENVPAWLRGYCLEVGFKIGQQEAEMLTTLLGADLQKIANEIDKIRLNAPDAQELTPKLIRDQIGFSHEYHVFDLPEILISGNMEKLARVLENFLFSPKAAPLPLLFAVLYNSFSQLSKAQFAAGRSSKEAMSLIGGPWKAAELAMHSARRFSPAQVETCLLLLADYNAKAVGIGSGASDKALLAELCGRMVDVLHRPQMA